MNAVVHTGTLEELAGIVGDKLREWEQKMQG